MARLKGIDISHHQATTPNLDGLAFLFARATYGTSPDTKYGTHIAKARSKGLRVGAYHFGRNQSVSAQVTAFLNAAWRQVDFYVLDWESDGSNPPMTKSQAANFIALVQAATRKPVGLYRSESQFVDIGQDYNWVANWSSEPDIRWTFWQYRGSPLDLDYFNGTLADLDTLAGRNMQSFTFTAPPKVGTLVVKADRPHSYLRLADNTLHNITNVTTFGKRVAFGPVRLISPIPGGTAGADRATVYIVGTEAAALLASDVVFTETPVPAADCSAQNAKIIAQEATINGLKGKLSTITTIVSGPDKVDAIKEVLGE